MSNPNLLASQEQIVAGVIDPDAAAAAAYSTGWISMETNSRVQAITMVGAMVATSTVDAKLEQATDSSGTGVKDITGKAITQLTAAGSDDDQQAIINCRADELDIDNDFDHLRLTVTVATAASDMGAIVLAGPSRYEVAADLASVDEIIA